MPITLKFLKRVSFPYPITVMTNTLPIDYPDTVYVGEDVDWSSNLLKLVERMDEPFILWLENCIADAINPCLLERAVEASTRENVGLVRLCPNPGPTRYWHDDQLGLDIGEIDKSLPDAISCQAAIWHPRTLRDLLKPGESPWLFERHGSERAKDYPYTFLGTYGFAVRYADYMVRGVPNPDVQVGIDRVLKEDVP